MKPFHIKVLDQRVRSHEIVQIPASRRMIYIERRGYYLPFPPILFCLTTSETDVGIDKSLRVAFVNGVIRSLNDPVYFPALPNIYVDYWMGKWKVCVPFNGGLSVAIERFWNTRFTERGAWRGLEAATEVFGGYDSWAEFSHEQMFERLPLLRSLTLKRFLLRPEQKVEPGAFNGFV